MEAGTEIKDQDATLEQAQAPKQSRDWRKLVDWISFQGIVNNMPYLMFVALLCLLYITNNNKAISLTRSINDKTKELKELKWRYMDLQSRLMFQTSEFQLMKKTADLGLSPLTQPAFEIKIDYKKRKNNLSN